jgi:hypothetical protein
VISSLQQPTTPYPTIVISDDVLNIYVDYIRIVETTSPDDALALLLSMFCIFELAFEKNGRVLRFLYAVMFGDKRYLSNTTRTLINEKSITINSEKVITTSGTIKPTLLSQPAAIQSIEEPLRAETSTEEVVTQADECDSSKQSTSIM